MSDETSICKHCGRGITANDAVSPIGGKVWPYKHIGGNATCQRPPTLAEPDGGLAAHDREVAAKALRAFKAVVRGEGVPGHPGELISVNEVEALLEEEAAALGVPVSPESEGKK